MPRGAGSDVRGYIRRLLHLESAPRLPDGDLLHKYVTEKDEAAFGALVQRYGPLVLGVCERVLQDAHAAEDAFQATFFVLIRRAGSLDGSGPLGNWLYAVAYRTAIKARARAARRRSQERNAWDMLTKQNGNDPGPGWSDLRPVIDEELNRLPEKYRAPLVLCYLEGKTNQEAARELGWPSGSMSRRVARGKELLRKRLLRRGIALSGTVALALLSEQAKAVVLSSGLQAVTVKAALVFKSGMAGQAAVAAGEAVALAKDVLLALKPSKVLIAAKVLAGLTACMSCVGIAFFAWGLWAGRAPLANAPEPAHVPRRLHERGYFPLHSSTSDCWGCLIDHTTPVLAVALSPDQQTLASGGEMPDTSIRLWKIGHQGGLDLGSQVIGEVQTRLFGHNRAVHALAFSPDGRWLASGSEDHTVRLWDTRTGQQRAALEGHEGPVLAVAFTPDGKTLISAGVSRAVILWDAATGRREASLEEHWGPVHCLAVSTDGRMLATGGQDQRIILWDIASRSKRAVLAEHADVVCSLAFSPDGNKLASSSWDCTVRTWDVAAARPLGRRETTLVRALAFTPDGQLLVLGCLDRKVRLADANTLKDLAALRGHESTINALACTRDGSAIVSCGNDQLILFWHRARPGLPGV